MATRTQIQQAVDLLPEVADLLSIRVPLGDLAAWAAFLEVDEMTVRLRYDGRVEATVTRYLPDSAFMVYAVADCVRDCELPACAGDVGFGQPVRLPVGDLDQLESFAAVKEGAAR